MSENIEKDIEESKQPEAENKGGRPALFSSVEDLQEKIKEYLHNCPDKKTLVVGEVKLEIATPTITGLAYHLGFESRQSFYDYEEKPEFSYTIKRARLFIEKEYEKLLSGGQCTGAIFALKNFGWKDKTEVENSGSLNLNQSLVKFVD